MRAMRYWLALVVTSLAMQAPGEEGDLSSRSKALAGKPLDAHATAPFAHAQDPFELFPFTPANEVPARTVSCAARTVCYELGYGSVVYRGARGYMPRIDGLTPEGVVVRHDRVILRYTFK